MADEANHEAGRPVLRGAGRARASRSRQLRPHHFTSGAGVSRPAAAGRRMATWCLARPFVVLDQPPRGTVDPIGDVRREPEVGRRVEHPEARDVAVVAPGSLERLALTLVAPFGSEDSGSLADEFVAGDDAPVAPLVDDADVRGRGLLFLRGFELHRAPPHDQKFRNSRPLTNASQAASWTRTLVTPVRNTPWR